MADDKIIKVECKIVRFNPENNEVFRFNSGEIICAQNDVAVIYQFAGLIDNTLIKQVSELSIALSLFTKFETKNKEVQKRLENESLFIEEIELSGQEAVILWRIMKQLTENPPKDNAGNTVIKFGLYHMRTINNFEKQIGELK